MNFIQVTCDSEREDLALSGEVVRFFIFVIYNNIDVINTAVVSLVGVVGFRKQEVGKQEVSRMIDRWLVVVVCCVETAVVSLVGVVCFRKQEVSRVIDSWQDVGVCCVVTAVVSLVGVVCLR